MNARRLVGGWDVALIDDPQPAALFTLVPEKARGWVWRCHIDTSSPNPDTMVGCSPYIATYPQSVFHVRDDAVRRHRRPRQHRRARRSTRWRRRTWPSPPEDAAYVCEQFGIDVDRLITTQVSRFDPWRYPLGVIDAMHRQGADPVDRTRPGRVEWPPDDSEGWTFNELTIAHAYW